MKIKSTTDEVAINSLEAEYWRVNRAVNEVFFDGRFQDRPVYLDPDGSLRKPLAQTLGVEEDKVDETISHAVACTLTVDARNIYEWHTRNAKNWDQRKDLPPFTALLLSLSLAAKHMREGDEISQNNYYGRLSEVYGNVVSREEASNSREYTREFWFSLNSWLLEKDFIYGRPTAQQITSWTYVSFALSQALVREADRDSFKKLFSRYCLSAEDGLSAAELEPYLAEWMSGGGPSGFLKRIWSDANLRDRVVAAAQQELEVWDGISAHSGLDQGVSGSRRLFWVVRVKKMPMLRIAMYLCIGNGSGDETDLSVQSTMIEGDELSARDKKSSTSFAFVNLPGADAFYLSPTESIDMGRAISGEVTLVDSHGTRYKRISRPIVPMTKGGTGHYYREVSQVIKHEQYVVLCHENWKQRVSNYLDIYGRQGYQYLAGSKSGLPLGWGLFEGVELVSSPLGDNERDLQDLVPVERGPTIYFNGGLPLARDVWHASCPPNVFATESESVLSLKLVEPGNKRDQIVVEEENSVENPDFIGKSGARLNGVYYTLMAYSGRAKRCEKNISFRTADSPRQIIKGEERELSYQLDGISTFDSAAVARASMASVPSIAGLKWLHEDLAPIFSPSFSFDEMKKFSFVKSNHVEYELTFAESSYTDETVEASTTTCISRGCHAWRVPFGVCKKTKMAILTCGDCGATVLWKAKIAIPTKRKPKTTLGTTRKVLVNYSDNKPTADQIYDALCYTRFGTWQTLQRILSHLVEEPWQAYEKAKELFDLGLIDLELDISSRRARSWSIPPSALVLNGSDRAYLSGFRCNSLLEELGMALEAAGARPYFSFEEGVPKHLSWDTSQVECKLLREIAKSVKDPLGREISITPAPSLAIARRLPSLSLMLAQFNETSLPVNKISLFVPFKNSWEETRFEGKSGLYRYDGLPRRFYLVNSHGESRNTTFELGKIAAARAERLRLHDYDRESQTFISVLGCEPPGLFRRALVSCSGKLPVFGDKNTLRYSGVSPELAMTILSKLYLEAQL